MEAIGSVSAVLQVVQTVGILANGIFDTCRRLHNAPKEFTDVRTQVSWIRSHLQSCESTLSRFDTDLLTPDIELSLTLALTEASSCFVELQDLISRIENVSSIESRVKWAAHNRSRANMVLKRLSNCRKRMESAMQLLNLQALSRLHAAIFNIQSGNADIMSSVAGLLSRSDNVTLTQTQPPNNDPEQDRMDSTDQKISNAKTRPERRLRADPWNLGPLWSALGVQGRGVPTTQSYWQDHHMSFAISAPLAQLTGNYALGLSVNVRTYSSNPWSFQLLRGSRLDISRIVPSSHSFLDACRRGDVADIRAQLLSGEGRLSDRDDKNWTALAYAISSGSPAAVEELLDHGADVEGTVGQLQTTPLQWALWHKRLDITRLLLRRQASQDRMNLRGWNTIFFCWARLRTGEPCMMEFLNLLAEDSYLDLDIADAQNWTVLDRVAAVGTSKEVRRLIDLGANPYQEAMPLRWTAIHQAVFHGNFATFEELLPEYGETAKHMVDERGWTLLHIAASAGHDSIVRHLLGFGLSPDAKSNPYESHMPEQLYGQRCTPQEVAAAQSPDREKAFLEALHEHRLGTGYVMIPSDSDSEDEQEFCEAKEYAS